MVAIGAARFCEIEAGDFRHHDVEDDGVEQQMSDFRAGLHGVGGRSHPIAVLAEKARQKLTQPAIIVDDQHMRRVVVGRRRHARVRHQAPPSTRRRTLSRSGSSTMAVRNWRTR